MSDSRQKQTRTLTISPANIYLKLSLESKALGELNPARLLSVIDAATRSLYGVIGAASLEYHVETTQPEPNTAILRVPATQYRRLWAAITTVTKIEKKPARLIVVCATPFWMALFEEDLRV
eukprot:GFKZ01007739.1.p1 GENE.GFKZ01007739.1~~GFKZ01007739.1.p1  ORF type:complete len:121 (+),score=13.05 GFKZ01007739.1:168-530(+)